MTTRTALSVIVAATLAVTSFAAVAQGRQQGGGQQAGQQAGQRAGQQQRQAERSMSQDRAMDHQRMQTRDRDRTQDGTQAQKQKQDRIGQAEGGAGNGIYGGNLMTTQERNQYREQLHVLQSEQERNEFTARHREQMQQRSKQRGVPVEVTSD